MEQNVLEPIPGILILDNFIENPEEIISAAFDRSKKEGIKNATIIKNGGEWLEETNTRNTQIIDVSPSFSNDAFWWLLSQKVWQFGDYYANYYGVSFSYMEEMQFLHYPKNQGFYNIHVDSAKTMPRLFSAVLYLNDVEKGGETYFDKFDFSISPIAGRIIMFPANFIYSHGAKTPESNDKQCIVTWFAP